VPRFLLPALMVGVGAGLARVGDRGEQYDQFTGAVAFPVWYVVLDHPDLVPVVGVKVLTVRAAVMTCSRRSRAAGG
jgi:hypothetical protein